MKSKYLSLFTAVLTFGLMTALAGGDAFAQGKGGGKGNKGGGGEGKHEKRDKGDGGGNGMGRGNGGGKHGGFQQERYEQPRFERPQRVERRERIQVYENPNAGRPQYRQERDDRSDWKQQRKADKREFKQERREARQPEYQYRPQIIVPRYEDRQGSRGNGRSWEGLPPGQYRKQANMERRDDRKAAKAYEKNLKRQAKIYRDDDRREYQQRVQYVQNAPVFWQQYTQNQSREYYDRSRYYDDDRSRYIYNGRDNNNNDYNDNNYDDDGYNGYDNGVSWKQQLLSTVLTQFLGGGFSGFGNSYDQNDGYGYDQQQYGYDSPNYYNAQYGGYQGEQYNRGYDNGGYDDNGYNNYDPNSFINAIPYAGLIDQFSGGFATDMIRQSLGMGYDEGYYAGQYARTNGTADDYYQDPYSYPNGSYDAASISLAERRRILSEGYELGYQDALSGRNQNDYDPQTDGDTDLVSLLLNSVLRMV